MFSPTDCKLLSHHTDGAYDKSVVKQVIYMFFPKRSSALTHSVSYLRSFILFIYIFPQLFSPVNSLASGSRLHQVALFLLLAMVVFNLFDSLPTIHAKIKGFKLSVATMLFECLLLSLPKFPLAILVLLQLLL